MSASEPSLRRQQPVRLTDIPLEDRLAAARREARNGRTPKERDDLIHAALFPSDDIYYVKAA